MTDELVKRLRSMHWCVTTEANGVGVSDRKVTLEAADRIEQLERELYICRMAQIVMDNSVAEVEALTAQNLRMSGMIYDLRKDVAISDALLISEAEASLERLARAEKAEARIEALMAERDYKWHPHELGGFTWKSKTSRN